jgi:hydroxymethylbilane synthase
MHNNRLPITVIGTRESRLAQWQAHKVSDALRHIGIPSTLQLIKTEGDTNLTTPLYEMGVQGIFTKALDIALLEKKIHLAVHSYKDIPTMPAAGLQVAAVLKRDNPFDVLVCNKPAFLEKIKEVASSTAITASHHPFSIASGSVRRKAQWLHRYPNSTLHGLRGNVDTRLEKLRTSHWDGAILAAAGLERLSIDLPLTETLTWMLPAPAQGTIAIMCRKDDEAMLQLCEKLNHAPSFQCTYVEKDFLRVLMGGCSTPIGAYATLENNTIHFTGNILLPNGSAIATVSMKDNSSNYTTLGAKAAQQLLVNGGSEIVKQLEGKI